jgi:hypothetical protein
MLCRQRYGRLWASKMRQLCSLTRNTAPLHGYRKREQVCGLAAARQVVPSWQHDLRRVERECASQCAGNEQFARCGELLGNGARR